jgi:hypothetical protein
MIAQDAMAFNSRRSPTTCPYSVPQILVTLLSLDYCHETELYLNLTVPIRYFGGVLHCKAPHGVW